MKLNKKKIKTYTRKHNIRWFHFVLLNIFYIFDLLKKSYKSIIIYDIDAL